MSEHDEQVCLFEWAAWQSKKYPELALLHAIPNGAKLPWGRTRSGVRFSPEANRLKKEGLKSGVPDVCLPVARGGFHGLYIEMKFGKNKPTKQQELWISMLSKGGYKAVVCYGCEEAIEVLEEYLA